MSLGLILTTLDWTLSFVSIDRRPCTLLLMQTFQEFYSFTPDGFLFKGSKSTYAPTRWYHFGNSNYHTEVQCVVCSPALQWPT